MKKTCPKCGSTKIKIKEYLGNPCIVCERCTYDESDAYDITPEERTSQREKGRYSPYKTGGSKRSR
jgi:DNA-directed RNA polymerase subunit M/transcription elongation factor TFIIS